VGQFHDILQLKGHLVCPKCAGHVTASSSKGNGGQYSYYHCLNSQCKHRIKVEAANEWFGDYLAAIHVKDEVLELYYEIMKDIFSSDDAKIESQAKMLDGQITTVETQLQNAQDKYMNNLIDIRDYNDIKKRYSTKLNDLKEQRETLSSQDSNMTKYMKYSFGLLQNLPQHYQEASFDIKQKLIGSIFPEKLVFEDSTYRTNGKNNIIDLLFNGSNSFKASKNKRSREKSRLPYQGSPS
jgi:site-specific DNA recombinase